MERHYAAAAVPGKLGPAFTAELRSAGQPTTAIGQNRAVRGPQPRASVLTSLLRVSWLVLGALMGLMMLASTAQAQGPALTTISDTVYRADGTPASGMVLISWPSFQTAEGDAVAAGNQSVTIGTGGAFTTQLVPNVGASPVGTYYVAVFQLDDGTVRTEYWAVPTTSPVTLAEVRTTPGTGLANLAATQQYVNAAVANRALDSTVVHLAGTETITGTKQFTTPPSLPQPVGTSDAANKGYVDQAVQNVGSGQYVQKAGDTMTGPLTLPGDPTAPNQAADRHYVDSSAAAKADLVSGLVPPGELGTGPANSATCLTGSSTWGSCGGGAPAGVTYATTALNWSQTVTSPLTGGMQATVTLTPCPAGIDTTSGAGYQVYISDGANSEAVNVTPNSAACTSNSIPISFTPFFSHSGSYTIESASSGIQETINASCGTSPSQNYNGLCNVTIPSSGAWNGSSDIYNNYYIYGTIFFHGSTSTLSGYGVRLWCQGRGPCLEVGDIAHSQDYWGDTVSGVAMGTNINYSSNPAYAGVPITATVGNGSTCTVTTSVANPGFRVGDMVTVLYTDETSYWGDHLITAVGGANNNQISYACGINSAQNTSTAGIVALTYVAVLDDAQGTHFIDVSYASGSGPYFNNFFDFWDDENATIDHFSNNGIPLNNSQYWNGSFVFSAGNGQLGIVAPVITLRDSNITANGSSGVSVWASNGVYVENTVIQASGPWQINVSNSRGNYQGAYVKNLYSESSAAMNGVSPVRSPWAGTGTAGYIAGLSTAAARHEYHGSQMPYGQFPACNISGGFSSCGTGTTSHVTYFVIAHDTTAGTQTAPMEIFDMMTAGSETPTIYWPRLTNGTHAITYDVISVPLWSGAYASAGAFPLPGTACAGGPVATSCGAATNGTTIALALTQATVCGQKLVCLYQDNTAVSRAAYFGGISGGNQINYGTWSGPILFWPGSLVTDNTTFNLDYDSGNMVGLGLGTAPFAVVQNCRNYGAATSASYITCLGSMPIPGAPQSATILGDQAMGSPPTKGRLNFSNLNQGIYPHHIVTLVDSQPWLTAGTPGYRPAASASDTWIGLDSPATGTIANVQLAFGAPKYIDFYINNVGDNSTYLERLAANQKLFNVPVQFNSSVTLAGLTNGCLNVASGVIGSTGSPCGSGGGGGSVSSVFGRTGAVVAQSGDYTVAQVTGAAADAAVVHNTGNETIAGTKTFTTNVTATGNLVLPQGSGYVPAAGGIGLDTAAGLPVVNMGGATHQVAFTSSNISGQAGTALALAQTPTQCSGSFATGIQANGNANCTTPDVIELAETTQPAGIPNWGVFWFDAGTHTPRVIENNGQPMQLGLTNLFNSDPGGDAADNLEERNGTTAQNFRVYSTYTNSSTWDRISLGSETIGTTNYNVLRSEDATSSNALSLGIHIGSGTSAIKWFFASDGTFKPNSDNGYDIGTDSGQAMRSVFAKTSFNMYSNGRQDFEFPNDPTNGTTLNQLAVYNSGASGVQTAATSSADGVVGIVSSGAGTANKAVITWAGLAACNFDATGPAAGDYVVASTTQAGKCHDSGSTTRPTGVQVIGRIEGGSVRVSLAAPSGGGGGGAVTSVFGRTGTVTAQNGDYSVGLVTGAAPTASPTFSGTVTLPDGTADGSSGWSGSPIFLSNVTINGNLNVGGSINQTGSSPTQWSGKEWTGTTVTVPSGMDFSLGVGSDNTFKCQLASGASCMPSSGGGMVYPAAGVANSTGSGWGTSYAVGTAANNLVQLNSSGQLPAISGANLTSLTAAQVGLGNVTNNAQTQAAIVPNTAPGAGQILVGNSGGTAYAPQAMSGDAAMTSAGAVTVAKVNGGSIPASANLVGTNASGQLIAQTGTISNNTTGTAANLSGTPTLPNGTLATTQTAGDNSQKLATTAYVKNETYFSWTCPVAGSTSVSQNCNWTVPAGLTITGFDFAANTAPVSCTTYPVVQVWDGYGSGAEVGSYSITLATGQNFYSQVTGSANLAAGHLLRIKVTTAASGCSTNAGGMVATVTYQMQN